MKILNTRILKKGVITLSFITLSFKKSTQSLCKKTSKELVSPISQVSI